MGSAELMVISACDQDWAELIHFYDQLNPFERGAIAKYLCTPPNERDGDKFIEDVVFAFARVAFLETGKRWHDRSMIGD